MGINWGYDGVDGGELLGDLAGADVLELGCGGGQCTVELARRGADVVGIDFTRNQLRYARDLVVFHETVSGVHAAPRDAGFAVETLLEPGSPDPDDYEPGPWDDSPPELRATVPQVLVVAASAPA